MGWKTKTIGNKTMLITLVSYVVQSFHRKVETNIDTQNWSIVQSGTDDAGEPFHMVWSLYAEMGDVHDLHVKRAIVETILREMSLSDMVSTMPIYLQGVMGPFLPTGKE